MLFIDNDKNIHPMDLRIWEPKEDGKTKNDHFRDMIKSAKDRGVEPEVILADSRLCSLKNVKCIRDLGWFWIMNFKKNRIINRGEKLEDINIPKQGMKVHLRGYGWINIFKFEHKNGYIRYIGTNLEHPNLEQIENFVKLRWQIEVFHRELKQGCGLVRVRLAQVVLFDLISLAYCLDWTT